MVDAGATGLGVAGWAHPGTSGRSKRRTNTTIPPAAFAGPEAKRIRVSVAITLSAILDHFGTYVTC
jgi:hypothetical protein